MTHSNPQPPRLLPRGCHLLKLGKLARVAALVAPLAAFYSPAFAETRDVSGSTVNIGGSNVALTETNVAGAVAEVILFNFFPNPSHGKEHEAELTLNGLTVRIFYTIRYGDEPDELRVEAPEGFIAVPPIIDAEEDSETRVLIYPRNAEMM